MFTRGRIIIWFIKHIFPWTAAVVFVILMGAISPVVFEFGNGIPLVIAAVALGIGLSFAQDSIIKDIQQGKAKLESDQDEEVQKKKKKKGKKKKGKKKGKKKRKKKDKQVSNGV